jgi:hypothetical protein
LLTGEVTHVNIAAARDNRSVMFGHRTAPSFPLLSSVKRPVANKKGFVSGEASTSLAQT